MSTSRQAAARVLAILALLAAVVALTAVIGGSLGESGDSRPARTPEASRDRDDGDPRRDRGGERDIYVVQSGDTLSAIAATTGVSIAELQELNPAIDPQLLISGQRLKLR